MGVLVLGCPQSVVDRWRVRIAVRSVDPQRALFVFSGAAVHTPISEAKMMADYAVGVLGVPPANVVIEDRSTTTVENVVNSAEVLADCAVVMVASNTLHAQRARRIMHDENPQLASRLVQARDYIPFEWGPLHLLLIVFEWYREWRVRKRNATS
ncbi:YdcF family protein [Mycobacterium sp. NPDC003323]